ncbi:MAG: FMN-binding glutamate synthase family protein [Betaproteobacteria bacterium]|nr:FMN-binding glutamate synthase family protein [Betaproteobacteria bacterium]
MASLSRFWALALAGLLCFISAAAWLLGWIHGFFALLFGSLLLLGLRDVSQEHHAILRNYPIIGHFRFLFEAIRPEIRQYFIESDTERVPFSRDQRAIVYQRAKGVLDKRPFGSKADVYANGYEWINHSITPSKIASHDFRVLVGAQRKQPYSLSLFNVSAMSFGALSPNAILALNKGAKLGGFAHDTGEGSISRYHREPGGDLIWELGSGYFGARNPDGTFSEERFMKNALDPQVKMIEIKMSQGAKPGHGGVLPAPKVTPEIAEARGVEPWKTVESPAGHSAFSTPLEMMHFIERLRNLSGGKPTGFKLAIGHPWEFFAIVKAMLETGIVPDFIVVDGKEGGTGAAPAEFMDRAGTPMQDGLMLVHNTLVAVGLRDQIRIGAAGKIVTAFDMARTLALGADWCNAARGFMFALGCIQSMSCHTDRCPTGVATQDPLRQRALVVPDKAQRVHQFHHNTLEALRELLQSAGLQQPGQLRPHHIMHRSLEAGVLLAPGGAEKAGGPWAQWWNRSQAAFFHPLAQA